MPDTMPVALNCPYCDGQGRAELPDRSEAPNGVELKIEHTCPGPWTFEVVIK